jgi:hypothetical protein
MSEVAAVGSRSLWRVRSAPAGVTRVALAAAGSAAVAARPERGRQPAADGIAAR